MTDAQGASLMASRLWVNILQNASWVYSVGNKGKCFTTQHPQRSLDQCLNMFRVQLLQLDIQH